VLRLAQENDLDLTRVKGTGRGGRITRKDVLQALENGIPSSIQKPTIVEEVPGKEKDLSLPTIAVTKSGEVNDVGDIEIPLTPIRKTIAERMVRSKQEIPHAWLMMEADVTGLVQLRKQMKEEFKQREGVNLTFIPFFIKAVVDSLKEFPQLNSVWAENKIVLKKQIHISLAVGTEDALFVPVIHKADEKSILGLAKDVTHLIEKTRSGKLALSDMQGGTFTVNNTGSFGSIASTPIINHPQAAILSFESIVKRPVIVNNMIAIRDRMNLCLSIDHRIVDGYMAGRFLESVKGRLESYQKEDVI
jgi:2-oxoisovalerate dehydrogenase E2 component (dihydrolipoyl transacylase)